MKSCLVKFNMYPLISWSACLLTSIVICDVMCFCYFSFCRHANDVLRNETTMFEKYLKRVDPKDIGLQQASKCFCRVSLD